MHDMRKWMAGAAVLFGLATVAPWAMAQGDEAAEKGAGEEGAGEGASAEGATDEKPAGDEAKKTDQNAGAAADVGADTAGGDSAAELPGQTYRFVGARYRGIIVPKFMINLFGDGGRTVYVHSFGPEFAIRKDGFEYVFALWWAGYYMDDTPFKSSSDPNTAWEIVKSNLNVIYLTSDFLWSQELGPQFAVNYGMGAGFGIVFGSLERTQAYPTNGQLSQDPYQWQKCSAPGNPAGSGGACGNDNDHYNGYTEPSWADGGSKPVIFPWLALQTGLRYKPAKQFVARLDAGFGISGFFIGLGADYGL
jgi:hypothetical protein